MDESKTPRNESFDPVLPESFIEHISMQRFDYNDSLQIKFLCEMWSDAFDDKRRWRRRSKKADIQSKMKIIDEYILNHPEKLKGICVAVKYSKIVGAICVALPGQCGDLDWSRCVRHSCKEREAHIEWIGVTYPEQKRGIGRLLLRFADNYARANGCEEISLAVVKGNLAKRLYMRSGYQVTKEECCCCSFIITGYCGGEEMVKNLNQEQPNQEV